MDRNAITLRLIERGWEDFRAPRKSVPFTQIPGADKLLNDLQGHPHAFVLACVMDRQIKAEKAWVIPYWFAERLGGVNRKRKIPPK